MRINEGHRPRQKIGRDYVRRVHMAWAVAEKWRWLQSFLHRAVGKGTQTSDVHVRAVFQCSSGASISIRKPVFMVYGQMV